MEGMEGRSAPHQPRPLGWVSPSNACVGFSGAYRTGISLLNDAGAKKGASAFHSFMKVQAVDVPSLIEPPKTV